MDGMKTLERLAAAARREPPPRIDVSEKVLVSLRAHEEAEELSRYPATLVKFSAASFAAAILLGVFALDAWFTLHDPLARLFDTVAMGMK
jgi:hypothetical protein